MKQRNNLLESQLQTPWRNLFGASTASIIAAAVVFVLDVTPWLLIPGILAFLFAVITTAIRLHIKSALAHQVEAFRNS